MATLLLPVLLFLIFLVPPYLLLLAIIRLQLRKGILAITPGLAYALVFGLIAVVLNTAFVTLHAAEIANGQLGFTWPVVLALLVSWCTGWGHMAMRPMRRRSHRT